MLATKKYYLYNVAVIRANNWKKKSRTHCLIVPDTGEHNPNNGDVRPLNQQQNKNQKYTQLLWINDIDCMHVYAEWYLLVNRKTITMLSISAFVLEMKKKNCGCKHRTWKWEECFNHISNKHEIF